MNSVMEKLFDLPPFGVSEEKKSTLLQEAVTDSVRHHYENCEPYRRFIEHTGFDPSTPVRDLSSVPFLPTSIFKRMRLASCDEDDVVRVIKSSGTSSQVPSQIPLDNLNRRRQMKALTIVLKDMLGASRIPFIVCDESPKVGDGRSVELSARIAGMRGYLMAASDQDYILDREEGETVLNRDKLQKSVDQSRSEGKPVCLLGYTYMIYQYVVKPLWEDGVKIDLPDDALILHFGGWKKLKDQAVSRTVLTNRAKEVFGVLPTSVRDIYGFTEQLGVIYPDDGTGVKRTPVFSEVIVRDPVSLEPLPDGEIGLLEFITPVPSSYPGTAILMDDMGRIVTREPSNSGRCGTGFEVTGRAEGAETRGCGDTLPEHMYEN